MTQITGRKLRAHATEEVDNLRALEAALDLDLAKPKHACAAVDRLRLDESPRVAPVLRSCGRCAFVASGKSARILRVRRQRPCAARCAGRGGLRRWLLRRRQRERS